MLAAGLVAVVGPEARDRPHAEATFGERCCQRNLYMRASRYARQDYLKSPIRMITEGIATEWVSFG
jgi:hypothetical protein